MTEIKIEECLTKANNHGVRIFGDYVINFLVPKLKDTHLAILDPTINIWFVEKNAAFDFIKDLSNSNMITVKFRDEVYKLCLDNNLIAKIKILIAEKLPGYFDIMQLYYQNNNLFSLRGNFAVSVNFLIEQINNKRVYMHRSYSEMLESEERNNLLLEIQSNYIEKGWTIRCCYLPDEVIIKWKMLADIKVITR